MKNRCRAARESGGSEEAMSATPVNTGDLAAIHFTKPVQIEDAYLDKEGKNAR